MARVSRSTRRMPPLYIHVQCCIISTFRCVFHPWFYWVKTASLARHPPLYVEVASPDRVAPLPEVRPLIGDGPALAYARARAPARGLTTRGYVYISRLTTSITTAHARVCAREALVFMLHLVLCLSAS